MLVVKMMCGLVQVKVFTCGHVIPDENLLPLVMCRGPSNLPFNFSYKNRANPHLGAKVGTQIHGVLFHRVLLYSVSRIMQLHF